MKGFRETDQGKAVRFRLRDVYLTANRRTMHAVIFGSRDSSTSHGVKMRLFAVHNKNYKLSWVIAVDLDDALALATKTMHIGRPSGYRKWKDHTDEVPNDLPELARTLLEKQERGLVTTFPPSLEWRQAP